MSHKLMHTADLHLAPKSAKITRRDRRTNRLLRDLDMEHAFETAVQSAIDVADEPDRPHAFVIAGDVFDSYRGSLDAMMCVQRAIRRLRGAGYEVLCIAGNHDTPANRLRRSMYEVVADMFSGDDGVTMAYDAIERRAVDDVEYVLLPHLVLSDPDEQLTEARLEPRLGCSKSVLVVHGVAEGDPSLMQGGEIREVPVAKWIMDMGWDYIAFGHYHRPGWIPGYAGKALYPGSLENTVISGPDVSMRRGPVLVDLDADPMERFAMIEQHVREIVELPDIDASADNLTADELDQMIVQSLQSRDLADCIVHNRVTGVTPTLYRAMPRRTFGSVVPGALYVQTEIRITQPKSDPSALLSDDGIDVASGEGRSQFRPLADEIAHALDVMVDTGKIPKDRRGEVADILDDLMTA